MAVYKLGDIVDLLPIIKRNDYKFINYLDLSNSTSLKFKKIVGKFPSRAKWLLINDSILIGRVRPNNRNAAFIHEAPINSCASSGFSGFVGKENIVYTKYLWLLLNNDCFWNYCVDNAKGETYPEVSQASIMNYIVDVPDLNKQKKIIDIIEPIFTNLDNQSNELELIVSNLKETKLFIERAGFNFIKKNGQEVTFKDILEETSVTTLEDNALPLYSVGTKGISEKVEDITYLTSGHKIFNLNELLCGLGIDEIHWNDRFNKGCISNAYSVYKPLKQNINFYKFFLIPQLKLKKNLFTQNTNRRPEAIKKKLMKELKGLYFYDGDLSTYSNAIEKINELIYLISDQITAIENFRLSILKELIK